MSATSTQRTSVAPRTAIADRPPENASPARKLAWTINFAVLAPSKHNTQPWYFDVGRDAVEIHADGSRALPASDPYGREMLISCGAALANLRLGVRALGHEPEVHVFPQGKNFSLLARIGLGDRSAVTEEEQRLIDAVPRRHTQRLPLDGRDLSEGLLSDLVTTARREGAVLQLLRTAHAEHVVAEIVGRAHRADPPDESVHNELLAWSRDCNDTAPDGVPFNNRGLGGARAFTRYPMRDFDLDKTVELPEVAGVDSPVAALLCTARDEPAEWLIAGQALEMVLLRACVDNVQASFLNQPIENPALRRELADRLDIVGYPQMVLRLGWGVGAISTPRRSASDITTDHQRTTTSRSTR